MTELYVMVCWRKIHLIGWKRSNHLQCFQTKGRNCRGREGHNLSATWGYQTCFMKISIRSQQKVFNNFNISHKSCIRFGFAALEYLMILSMHSRISVISMISLLQHQRSNPDNNWSWCNKVIPVYPPPTSLGGVIITTLCLTTMKILTQYRA